MAKLQENTAAADGYAELIAELCADALSQYGVRILDNIDLGRIDGLRQRARVIGKALMDRGDARAFVLGRRLISAIEN